MVALHNIDCSSPGERASSIRLDANLCASRRICSILSMAIGSLGSLCLASSKTAAPHPCPEPPARSLALGLPIAFGTNLDYIAQDSPFLSGTSFRRNHTCRAKRADSTLE